MSHEQTKKQAHSPGKFLVVQDGKQNVRNIGSMLLHTDDRMQLIFPDLVMLNADTEKDRRQLVVSHREANLVIDLDQLAQIASWYAEHKRDALRRQRMLPKFATAAMFLFSAVGVGISFRWLMALTA